MLALHHVLIATAYTLIAAAIAVALPQLVPQIDQQAGAIIGGVALIGSALLHEVFSRQEGELRLIGSVNYLREELGVSRAALDAAESEISQLRTEVETLRAAGADSAGKRDVDSVIAEVKVLQGLIEQFSVVRLAEARRTARGGGEAATRMPPLAEIVARTPPMPVSLVAKDGEVIKPFADGLDDASILSIVRDGLEQNRVDLVLQPVVRLPQRKRAFYEAFTRIRDGKGSMLVPEQYIGIAEREGLVAAIDNMLLFRCVQLVRRTRERNSDVGFFCNISAHSLTDRHFFSNFVEFMADNSALAPNLIFEFPYATIANRDEGIERHLAQLAGFGFRFSVDQVSGLNIDYDDLMRLRFKYVKIDSRILLEEVRSQSGPIAAEGIKRIIDRHGIDLIAEKIEAEADLLELLDLRIDYGQGYLFGEPRLAKVD